jgi:hypothetical protein
MASGVGGDGATRAAMVSGVEGDGSTSAAMASGVEGDRATRRVAFDGRRVRAYSITMGAQEMSFALLAAACLQACSPASQECPGNVVTPVTVTVIDSSTGLYVCDAVLTASDGSWMQTASAEGATGAAFSDASCLYVIDPHRSGTYAISATAAGLHMTQPAPSFSLTFDTCGYEGTPHSVTIVLSP